MPARTGFARLIAVGTDSPRITALLIAFTSMAW
jgi:hypothetical protein